MRTVLFLLFCQSGGRGGTQAVRKRGAPVPGRFPGREEQGSRKGLFSFPEM